MRVPVGALLAAVAISMAGRLAHADDYFVVTGTFQSQAAAQVSAAESGGWALDTDLYSGLKPNLFAVVRGPFRSSSAAKSELKFLTSNGDYRGSYVKASG